MLLIVLTLGPDLSPKLVSPVLPSGLIPLFRLLGDLKSASVREAGGKGEKRYYPHQSLSLILVSRLLKSHF